MSVILRVNGFNYEGWKKVSVTRSVSDMAGSFDLTVSERWSGLSPGSLMNWRIRPGDKCELLYLGIKVITGYVDVYSPSYDAQSHEVSIQGRSKTGDLCDCSAKHPGGEMKKVTLDQIARTLTKDYGIDVKTLTNVGEAFDDFRIEVGETVHEAIERYARARAIAPTDDEDGNLVLMRVENGGAVAKLIEGVNILKASATLRSDNRHSEITVKGQKPGTDQSYGKDAAQIKATATDPAVKRHRPLVLVGEGATPKMTAKQRADWESAYRAGESVSVEATVQDWLYAPGKLWHPGDQIEVKSPMLAVERTLALQTVNFTIDEGGTLTSLSLVPTEALNPGGGSSGGSGSDQLYTDTKPPSGAT